MLFRSEVIDANRSQITTAIGSHRLPAVYPWRLFVLMGGLMSYGESVPGFHHRSATYVHRILKGTPAAELPIEQPSNHELAINIGAAKAQGLEIPKVVLFRADHLVQ